MRPMSHIINMSLIFKYKKICNYSKDFMGIESANLIDYR